MLKYISKILRDAPNTHLHNALYNMLNDSTFRVMLLHLMVMLLGIVINMRFQELK